MKLSQNRSHKRTREIKIYFAKYYYSRNSVKFAVYDCLAKGEPSEEKKSKIKEWRKSDLVYFYQD